VKAEHSSTTVLRLQVTAEPDPGAVARVLERFQNLNLLPRRMIAETGVRGMVHIQVDVCGMTEERLTLITAKLREHPTILNAHWHPA
jgi:hypothetical protein